MFTKIEILHLKISLEYFNKIKILLRFYAIFKEIKWNKVGNLYNRFHSVKKGKRKRNREFSS